MTNTTEFLALRDMLLRHREDLGAAQREFRWPQFREFNWVQDYFDAIAHGNTAPALRIVNDRGADETLSFAEIASRSRQVAAFLAALGVERGDRLLIMLPNCTPLWEVMLAAIRAGVVVIPATTLLQGRDLFDRLERGNVKAVITETELVERFTGFAGVPVRIVVGPSVHGWTQYADSAEVVPIFVGPATRADDLMLLYFTSGTTARPKLVAHTHVSYPVGHLSTMYWLGLKPKDVHLNLSSPGWAKHAWSSLFAPWNAQASVLAYQYDRFDPRALLDKLVECEVTSFCAPPTVWRMLVQYDLRAFPVILREVASAGEPLNAEVIAQVHDSWGLTVRDAFGQTETTAQVGNPPGQRVKPGSMGRPLPGYEVVLLDVNGQPAAEGEICLNLDQRPLGLMQEYLGGTESITSSLHERYYHTGDVASRDDDGYLTYVGRTDDLFKSSDYRISPFELESVLIQHPLVLEAAVVPSPDPLRMCVPKAFVTLAEGVESDAFTAAAIFQHVRSRVPPYKRVRRIEFASLPKTISGKIRRVELRKAEDSRGASQVRNKCEFWEEDFQVPGTPKAGP